VDVWTFITDHGSEFWDSGFTHAKLVGTALLLAVPIAIAVGVLGSSRPRLAGVALSIAGVIITIPSFALFGLLIAPLGLGFRPAVVTLALYSLLPVLRNTIVGLQEVPSEVVEAARAMGMTGRQALWRVRMPIALPVIIAGVRVATVMIVGITTIAALITAGGLGSFIFDGLRSSDRTEIIAGTVVIVALALAFDGALAIVERLLRRHSGRERHERAPLPVPA
jgi:osmoprotectant transport system permease protein